MNEWSVGDCGGVPQLHLPRLLLRGLLPHAQGVRAKLLQAFIARGERIFKLDDVFMTGILAKEAGITHRQISPMVTSVPIAAFEGTLPKGGGFHHAPGGLKERYWMWRRIQMARAVEASGG